ncbi:MAG TPA: sucrase ferredoxin [Actinomycetales bacterium]|nr:sucrase ferredoxin [Actinomycetales bacterium]
MTSLDRREPLAGTASAVRAFLLIECSGPWGVEALRDSPLPQSVMQPLRRSAARHGVRPLLIRRHGRQQGGEGSGLRVFAAWTGPASPWLETVQLTDPQELIDLDLRPLADGTTMGWEQHLDPVFLVCTHGRHDVCCAERGRPVARALSLSHPAQTWEVSHIGGDRFAANVLVLPDGLYYGRVDAATAPGLAATHLRGELDLERLRGRSCYGFAAQAAEIHLRRTIGLRTVRGLHLTGIKRAGNTTIASFTDGTQQWTVEVQRIAGDRTLLTCKSNRAEAPILHRLVAIERG